MMMPIEFVYMCVHLRSALMNDHAHMHNKLVLE
jgi:hypothetical protein